MADQIRYAIEDDMADDGLMWRATARDSYGNLVDATRWVRSPARAVGDELLLMRGTYWREDPNAQAIERFITAA